jgi:NADP-dependent 3-hydroxy acid dehydrogenase YdfG
MTAVDRRRGVVFGASSGIGAAVVARLAGQGTRLYSASRRGSCDVDLAGVSAVSADVRLYGSVAQLLRSAASERGGLGFVVNSAGVGYYAPLGVDHSDAWREILETNILGIANICSVLLEEEVQVAHLVQIGSVAAYRVSKTPGNAIYSAAKTAAAVVLDHFRTLLRERGSETRVSLISPGLVEGTEFAQNFFRYSPDHSRPLYVAGDNLTPGDIADVVAYVLSAPQHVDIDHVVVRPTLQGN